MEYFLLALLWSAWCFLHSALISLKVTDFLKTRLKNRYRFFRLIYNGIALLTLIPVVLYSYGVQAQPIFQWQGFWRIAQVLLMFIAIFLFAAGAKQYDALTFFGLRQLKEAEACSGLTEDCDIDTSGILGVVRHPWYTGGFLIIWARNLDVSAIITNLVLSGYFFIGTHLEERKLADEFPGTYRAYQKEVSMFFPWKWLKLKLKRGEKAGD